MKHATEAERAAVLARERDLFEDLCMREHFIRSIRFKPGKQFADIEGLKERSELFATNEQGLYICDGIEPMWFGWRMAKGLTRAEGEVQVKQVLIDARKLIELPEHWTQYASARAKNGNVIDVHAKDAYCWCSFGAIDRFAPNYDILNASCVALQNVTQCAISSFNDTRTHAEVLAAFDLAIASC